MKMGFLFVEQMRTSIPLQRDMLYVAVHVRFRTDKNVANEWELQQTS